MTNAIVKISNPKTIKVAILHRNPINVSIKEKNIIKATISQRGLQGAAGPAGGITEVVANLSGLTTATEQFVIVANDVSNAGEKTLYIREGANYTRIMTIS